MRFPIAISAGCAGPASVASTLACFKQWTKAIGHILEKKYYHNLENVNILLVTYIGEESEFIDDFFKVLKQNQKLLKHQFRQFNIGIHMENKMYFTIKWNKKIDDKFLDDKKKEIINCSSQDKENIS